MAIAIRVAKGGLASFSCNFSTNGFTLNTSWVLGPGGEQVTEYAVSSGASTWKHTNAFASGKLLGTYDGLGLHFYFDDWLGTRRVQTNALGQLEETCRSLPYGNGLACTPTNLTTAEDPTEQHFTGKERDSESGNDYFGARYYASSMGRFMSPDWSAKEDPVPYAKLDDPQSLNLYSYVGNNPLGKVDKDGHVAGVDDAVVVGAVGFLGAVAIYEAWAHTPSGQRTLDNLATAAKENFNSNLSAAKDAVTSVFSKSSSPEPSATPAAGEKETQPLVGNNPKEAGSRTNTDLPGGHSAAEKTFGEQTAGQQTRTDPKTGHQVSEDGSRLRKNPDGTARVDLPNRGAKPNGETIHFNQPDPKPQP